MFLALLSAFENPFLVKCQVGYRVAKQKHFASLQSGKMSIVTKPRSQIQTYLTYLNMHTHQTASFSQGFYVVLVNSSSLSSSVSWDASTG